MVTRIAVHIIVDSIDARTSPFAGARSSVFPHILPATLPIPPGVVGRQDNRLRGLKSLPEYRHYVSHGEIRR